MKSRSRIFCFSGQVSAFVMAALMVSPPALAQGAEAPDSEEVSGGIEEIIVTARKRDENVQDIPVAVTALSGDALAARGVETTADIARFTPNLQLSNGTAGDGGPTSMTAYIRGVGQDQALITYDPGVGMYLDGVYISRSVGALMDVLDLSSVEILRGPQGTLYGKNTIGGAINLTSAMPSGSLGGKAEVTLGRFDRLDFKASLNVPLVQDVLDAKLTLARLERDGYADRVVAGDTMGDDRTYAAQGIVRWTPSERVTVTLIGDYTDKNSASNYQQIAAINTVAGLTRGRNNLPTTQPKLTSALIGSYGNYESGTSGPNFSNTEVWGSSGTIDIELSDTVALKSITAYRGFTADLGSDNDGTSAQIVESIVNQKQNQLSQELQLLGQTDRFKWLIGGFYMRENVTADETRWIFPEFFPFNQACLPNPPQGNPRNCPPNLSALFFYDQDVKTSAVFAQATAAISDSFNITAGIRYSHEAKELSGNTRFLLNPTAFLVQPYSRDDSWDAFTPMVSVDLKLSQDAMIYAIASQGFKSGGFVAVTLNPAAAGESYDPEKIWTYESGLKAEWLGGTLRTNVAAFYSDYSDVQLSGLENGVVRTTNAGKAEIYGAELEVVARPAPGLDYNLSVGYLHTKIAELAAGVTSTAVGNRLVRSPTWTLNTGLQYAFDLAGAGTLTLRSDATMLSKYYNDIANYEDLAENGYVLVNLRATYALPGDQFELSLFGNNVTNAYYKTGAASAFNDFGFNFAFFGRPAEWGAALKVKF
ncbi:MAG: TonB-dependent receptor [Sphingomonadaceae bacterium]|nr:TonB-dependent receptor [Sphingomonadaceae bacterium]